MKLENNILVPLTSVQIPFQVDKYMWFKTAILGHEREVNQFTNTLQTAGAIVILRTLLSGRNTVAEVAHVRSLPLCNFTLPVFWYTEFGKRLNFFPGIVEHLLLYICNRYRLLFGFQYRFDT